MLRDSYAMYLTAALAILVVAALIAVYNYRVKSQLSRAFQRVLAFIALLLLAYAGRTHLATDHGIDSEAPLEVWPFLTAHPVLPILGVAAVVILWVNHERR